MSSKVKNVSFDLSDDQEKELYEKINSHSEKFATKTKQLWADHLQINYEVKKAGRKPFVDKELIEKQKAEKREALRLKRENLKNEKASQYFNQIINRKIKTEKNILNSLQHRLLNATTDLEKNLASGLIETVNLNIEQLKSQLK